MESGEGRPAQPGLLGQGERSANQPGSAVTIVRGLIQRQQLQVGTISEYCTMWSDMALQARKTLPQDEAETVCTTIRNVGLGLDYLAFTQQYNEISEGHKTFVREDIPVMLKNEGTDRVMLPYEDAKLLQQAAAAVNIAYNPGEPEDTPENIKKRTFVFSDLEQKALDIGIPESVRVVDAE